MISVTIYRINLKIEKHARKPINVQFKAKHQVMQRILPFFVVISLVSVKYSLIALMLLFIIYIDEICIFYIFTSENIKFYIYTPPE